LERSEKQGCHAGVKRRRALFFNFSSHRFKTTAGRPTSFTHHCDAIAMASINDFYYVYISLVWRMPKRHYIGITRDLPSRLAKHNRGKCPHTTKHKPWKIETAVAFRSEAKARRFERYLKTGSGREFSRRHF